MMRFSTSESKVMVMEIDAPATTSDQSQKPDTFTQVLYTEKQLLSLIHKKCLLHKDVQELYRKVRDGYERIILNEHDVVELQEVEHFLWKLHYKHIDEFRKSIRQISTSGDIKGETSTRVDAEAQHSISRYFEGFKSFLSEAAEFYRSLIIRFKAKCGLSGELFIYKNGGSSISMEPMKLSKCQFACHRFLICLGDLARYGELCKKQDSSKWSAAFTYYLEANRMCPASGNPHNQLALLATYVNDSFLALYHCTRSLAVKEPFPDAWNNLMLLFEESRTSHALPLSSELQLDFLKPSEKISPSISNLETSNSLSPAKTELWPLFVRLITFFLGRSSLEEFACTLSATVKELEALVLLDDEQLKAALESYELMDSSRRGPYRALQLVYIFVFVLHSLTTNPQQEKLNEKDQEQKSPLTIMALIAAFICIARLVERCVKGNQLEKCPLLPAVMVFVEWLVGELDMLEAYAVDEKVMSAMSYFFHVLTDLLNRLNINEAEIALDKPALWEDHELRGFEPLAHAQISLDFTTHWEWVENFNCKRSQRISHAGMRFASRSNYLREWIRFDRKGMKFYLPGSMGILGRGISVKDLEVTSLNLEVKEPEEQKCWNEEVYEKDSPGENQPQLCQKSFPVPAEEEEVILFKPITRHNSAPLYQYITEEDHIPTEGSKEPSIPADECLRRATSMFIGQSQPRSERFSFPSDASNISYHKPHKQQEAVPKESATYPAGPPSLNAWVFVTEDEPEKGVKNFTKQELSPIPEVAVEPLASLSIDDMKDSVADSVHVYTTGHNDPPTYVAPVPSAPLLPDDAIWFGGNAPSIQEYGTVSSKEGDGILGAAPPIYGYQSVSAPHGPLDFSPVFSGLVHGYPPPILGMSSSEWLYHYRNNQKLEQTNTYIRPVNFSGPGPLSSFYTSDISRLDLLNQRGNPLVSAPAFYLESPQLYPASSLVYGADGRRMDNLFSYQRPSPFVCGAVNDSRTEQQQLLHYHKEKEWQMLSPQLKGSTFMGN